MKPSPKVYQNVLQEALRGLTFSKETTKVSQPPAINNQAWDNQGSRVPDQRPNNKLQRRSGSSTWRKRGGKGRGGRPPTPQETIEARRSKGRTFSVLTLRVKISFFRLLFFIKFTEVFNSSKGKEEKITPSPKFPVQHFSIYEESLYPIERWKRMGLEKKRIEN